MGRVSLAPYREHRTRLSSCHRWRARTSASGNYGWLIAAIAIAAAPRHTVVSGQRENVVSRTMIEVEPVSKRFGETQALAAVDLAAETGKVLALVSPVTTS